MTDPSLRARDRKEALAPGEGQPRLWDCPTSGGPFCPLDCPDPDQVMLNRAWRDCGECGGWILSY